MPENKNLLLYIAIFFLLYSFYPALNESINFLNGFLVIIVFLGFCSYTVITNRKFQFRKSDIRVLSILGFWFCYSLASSIWAQQLKLGIIDTFHVLIILLSFYLAVQLLNSLQRIVVFSRVLIVIFVIYLLTALWEIVTLNHLPVARHAIEGVTSFIPFGPFYNENNMAAVLIMIMPFPYFALIKTKSIPLKILLFIFIIFLGVELTMAGARLGMIFYALANVIFIIFYASIKLKLSVIIGIILIVVIFATALPQYSKIFKIFLHDEIASLGKSQESYREGSIKIRKNLIKETFEMAADSYFFGVGSGDVKNTFALERFKRTQGILIPHNFFLEVLCAYGLVITLMLLYVLFYWFIELLKIIKSKKDTSLMPQTMLYVLILFVPASILPSSIIRYNLFWMVFAAIHQYINLTREKYQG